MSSMIRCAHCQSLFKPNPRVKNQGWCSQKECQRARKNQWQKHKLATDPDYKANQLQCQREWHKRHPDYYRNYRSEHPQYAKRNRLLQKYRNTRRRPAPVIAKMDALAPDLCFKPGTYYLVPLTAKMDALTQKSF